MSRFRTGGTIGGLYISIDLDSCLERFISIELDLLSIDIENHEYEVLQNFDFKKYKIDVIVTECHDLEQNKLEKKILFSKPKLSSLSIIVPINPLGRKPAE